MVFDLQERQKPHTLYIIYRESEKSERAKNTKSNINIVIKCFIFPKYNKYWSKKKKNQKKPKKYFSVLRENLNFALEKFKLLFNH